MSSAPPAQYLITLCTAAQQPGLHELFGVAYLNFSPAPDSVAVEFLNELTDIGSLVEPVSLRASPVDCVTWARQVMDFLSLEFTENRRSVELKPFADLASHMLSHLLIARKKTPQESTHPSPNINCLWKVRELLDEAITKRSQLALMDLIYLCNGVTCPFTGLHIAPPGHHLIPQCAHIIPFSFQDKHLMLQALESFTGCPIAMEVKENINHPCNVFNVESNIHESFDKLGGLKLYMKWKYFFWEVCPKEVAITINLIEGQEIIFHLGPSSCEMISKPNPISGLLLLMYCMLVEQLV